MAVNAISEVATEPEPTLGETPVVVCSNPKTTQGWRPISVKIQPKLLAANGSPTDRMLAPQNQRAQRPSGSRPRRVSQRPSRATRIGSIPSPIINRNDQYAMGTYGR